LRNESTENISMADNDQNIEETRKANEEIRRVNEETKKRIAELTGEIESLSE